MNELIFKFGSRKVIYFRVPKVASTSLLIAFRKCDEVEKYDQYDQSYFKFAFVRNPFDRLVSCYKHLILKASVGTIYNNPGIYKGMSFEEFVNAIEKIPVKEMDIHFRPQWTFIPENPDFLGKFENLENDFNNLCEKINIKVNLPHKNFTFKSDYRDYYNDIIIKKVITIYEKDFEKFGYQKTL